MAGGRSDPDAILTGPEQEVGEDAREGDKIEGQVTATGSFARVVTPGDPRPAGVVPRSPARMAAAAWPGLRSSTVLGGQAAVRPMARARARAPV
jgi:hypothetical protein